MTATEGRVRPYLHVRVSDALRSRITSREIPPGALLPSEQQLTEDFGVSRSVVRQALRTLADEGLIQVARGRGAVVTAGPEWHRDAQQTAGLSAQMRSYDTRVGTEVLSYSLVAAGEESARLGVEQVLVLERRRLLDGEPVAFIRTWLPGWVADKISESDLQDASLHRQLHDQMGVDVHGGPRQIRAVAAAGGLAQRLDVQEGAPVLLLQGESLDQAGRIVEVFSTWHRSDRIALDISVMDPVSRQLAAEESEGGDPMVEPAAREGEPLRVAEDALLVALRAVRSAAARPAAADR